jgi:hypothetical protein
MIQKLRENHRREQGAADSLDPHDRLLSYGDPPVVLLWQVLLTEQGNPAFWRFGLVGSTRLSGM